MSTGRQGSAQVTCSVEDSPGGTARAMESFAMQLGELAIHNDIQDGRGFGEVFMRRWPTGTAMIGQFPITGHFETTGSTGPHAVFAPTSADRDPNSVGREVVVVVGDSKTFTFTAHLEDYKVILEDGALTQFEAVLNGTGAGVWT